MKKINHLVGFITVLGFVAAVSGCAKKAPEGQVALGKNLVTAGNISEDKTIEDAGQSFRVMAKGSVQSKLSRSELAPPNSVEGKAFLEKFTSQTGSTSSKSRTAKFIAASESDPTSLVVGIPIGLLGEQYFFDGVIVKVSDQQNPDLGNLKLSDLTGLHAKLSLVGSGADAHLSLMGCTDKCTENSPLQEVQAFPVVAVDTASKRVMVDLAAVSKDLDLLAMFDPDGSQTHLKTSSTKTVSVDYSLSTLVFDVESHMLPVGAAATDPGVQETVFTTRWFLRMGSVFNPAFEARVPADGVGFFLTQRSAETKITRWSTSSPDGVAPVHYYVKNVPAEYQAAFQSAFDEWNAKLSPVVGKNVFSYEFVPANDPRNALLVPGDPRYNIVEWDLVNKATYGGLGPSIANQFTGENVTANVLVQGPTIEGLYKDWWKVNQQAQELRAAGQSKAADVLLIESRHQIFDKLDDLAARPKMSLTKGTKGTKGLLAFRIHSQLPELNDPVAQRNDFDPLPANFDYGKYMYGYFHDMLTHELGHNLGLRHNFRGNLGSTGNAEGQVSRSVMEYLSRDYRYLDHVGEYDLMALSYGYTGKKPEHMDWYCTDEDKADPTDPTKSAECSADDATADPFGWYQMRLATAINYLVDPTTKDAPLWTVDDMARELKIAVIGMGYYASSADATATTWTNFFTGGDRPVNAGGVKAYVISKLKAQLCDPTLDVAATAKGSADAQAKTAANVAALRSKTAEILAPLKAITAEDLNCQPALMLN